ncbi:pyridoxamine 5'-phosphate oxidase-domain-containing protein [Aspergillus venezuelensis]
MAPLIAKLVYGLCLVGTLSPVFATPLSSVNSGGNDQAILTEHESAAEIATDISIGSDALYMDSTSSDTEESLLAPSWFTSTLMARRLLALSSTGVVSTIFPNPLPDRSHAPPSVAGQSISLKEYFADCDEALPNDIGSGGNGDPTFLALRVATTFQNVAAGSNLSLSIDWWDHVNNTKPVFPGFPLSEAGLPRVTLFGYIEEFEKPISLRTERALRECYTEKHPDSQVWLPGRPGSPHSSFWAKMVVTDIYWIGGFGGFQQIGWMKLDEWKGIRRKSSLPDIGDGRGWEDVRLPGEN